MESATLPAESEDQAAARNAGETQQPLRHPYIGRLTLWILFLGVSFAALHALLGLGNAWRNPVAYMVLELAAALIAGCVVYCLWIEYQVSTERRMLLAAVAFTGLALSQLVSGMTCMIAAEGSVLDLLALRYNYAWNTAGALLLIIAARSATSDDKQYCRKIGIRALAGSALLSFILAAAAYGLGASWVHIRVAFPEPLRSGVYHSCQWIFFSLFMPALAASSLAVAFMVFAGRYLQHEDSFSDGVTRCLALAMGSQFASLASTTPYDMAWWASHALGVCALLVLLVELGIEFGRSHTDAHARIAHLEAVHYLSSRLSNTLDLRVVLLVLVSDTAGMLSARFASVMLADDAAESLTTVATYGLPEEPLNPRQPQKVEGGGRPAFFSSHTAKAFREKRVCMVDDVYADVEFVPWRTLARYDGYAVSVPLVYQDVPLGVMNLFFEKHVRLNDERIRLFQTLASAASVAVANAQLYDRSLDAHSQVAEEANPFLRRLAA